MMQALKQLNKKEKFTNLCRYLFIAILPIVGFISVSTYTFLYLKNDVDFVSKELDGLNVIAHLHESIFKLQRLRGLSSIVNCECRTVNAKIANDITNLKKEISRDILALQKLIRSKQGCELQEQLIAYFKTLDIENNPTDFKSLTITIEELLYFSNKIAYKCNLKLDPKLEPYIMVDNVVSLVPKIIEYNTQIQAASSAIQNKRLIQGQKEQIRLQISKIQERLDLLHFNYSMLSSYHAYDELEKNYEALVAAQNAIVNLVNKELMREENIEFEGLSIYEMISKDMKLIIDLHRSNIEHLKKELEEIYHFKTILLNSFVVMSVLSLLFLLYVYYYFYQTNKEFINTVENLSITDGMTHLYNRRYFDLIIEQELKLLQRQKESFAFMLLDIDFFKQYNDTYGHQAGDEALKKVAECLRNALQRESDMAFRLGGEEFGIVAVDMDESQALKLAQKVRGLITSEQIVHEKSSVSPYLSISIGVVVISYKIPWDVNKVYRSADKALYEAKEKGRNRVALFQSTT